MPPRLSLAAVFTLGSALISRRWVTLFGVGVIVWAAILVAGLIDPTHLMRGEHDLRDVGVYWSVAAAFYVIRWLRDTILITVSLHAGSEAFSLPESVRAATQSFSHLLPFWLLLDGPTFAFAIWSAWSPAAASTSYPRALAASTTAMAETLALGSVGLVVMASWGLSVPVAVNERRKSVDALRRSAALLAGERWRFMGLVLLISVVAVVPAAVTGFVLVFMPIELRLALRNALSLHLEREIASFLSAMVHVVWCVVIAAAYQVLRRRKEGAPYDQLADIFA